MVKFNSFLTKNKLLIRFFSLSVFVVIIDQLLKHLIFISKPSFVLGSFLKIELITNTGAGFGIFTGNTFLLAIISLLVAILIIAFYRKIPQQNFVQVMVGLFLGGTVGNLLDRSFRGYVIDFINFSFWPAFNFADMALTIATAGLIIYITIIELKNRIKK